MSSTRGLSSIYKNLLIQFVRVTIFFHPGLALPYPAWLVGLRIWLIERVRLHETGITRQTGIEPIISSAPVGHEVRIPDDQLFRTVKAQRHWCCLPELMSDHLRNCAVHPWHGIQLRSRWQKLQIAALNNRGMRQ